MFYNNLNQHLFIYSLYLLQDKTYTTFQHQRTGAESNPATPRSPSPPLLVQLEVHPESHSTDQTTAEELSPPTCGMQFSSSGRAEPAGIAPTRCLSPSATPSRQAHKCGPRGSEVVSQVVNGNSSVSLSKRLLQEVKLVDSTQHKVPFISTILTNNRPHTERDVSILCLT